jgi:ADP-heptose:LPS heptosyltransferase
MIFARAQSLHCSWKSEADELYDLVGDTLRLTKPQQVRLPIPDNDRRLIGRRLAEFGIRANTAFVAVQVGAKRPTNRWLPERFAQVIDFLQRENELPVVLIGGEPDSAAVEAVTNRMTTAVHTLVGKTTLLQTAALLEQSVLYIGNDTGPMHLAAAVGTPTVSIFSARDYPVLWFPTGDNHVVLRSDVPCSPCFKETCDRDLICLARIATSDVRDATERQLIRSGILTAEYSPNSAQSNPV